MACIAIGSTTHGKWNYKTVVLYTAGTTKDGRKVWLKNEVIFEATTQAKIERLAKAEAGRRGLPLMPGVRHYQAVSNA